MIATPRKTMSLLKQYKTHPKKKWGQNFLINPKTAKKIVDIARLESDMVVIEIGAGLGALSEIIASRVKRLICYEIDETLCAILKQELAIYPHVEIQQVDFLKLDLKQLFLSLKDERVVIVSNLPYYITSDIIIKILTTPSSCEAFVALMQKEVAIRIAENKGGKDINEVSIFSQLWAKTTYALDVAKDDFTPSPRVDSAIIRFDELTFSEEQASFVVFLRALFAQRRKTIYNNLLELALEKEIIHQGLASVALEPSIRAETLDLTTIQQLYAFFKPYL